MPWPKLKIVERIEAQTQTREGSIRVMTFGMQKWPEAAAELLIYQFDIFSSALINISII